MPVQLRFWALVITAWPSTPRKKCQGQKRRQNRESTLPGAWRTVSLHLSHAMCQNFCLFSTGHSIHGNLAIACSGKYCLIQSKQLNGISFSCATVPKNPISESFWTAPLWLWLDQMASWDICCSIKPFCIYHLWFLITVCFVCALKPNSEDKGKKIFLGTNFYSA